MPQFCFILIVQSLIKQTVTGSLTPSTRAYAVCIIDCLKAFPHCFR